MKLFFATLLCLVLMLPTLGSIVIYTQFKLAQDEISRTICVQRDNKINSCKGHCELRKSLKKYNDNENRMNRTNLKEKAELVYTATTLNYQVHSIVIPQTRKSFFLTFNKKPRAIAFALFRPPLV